MIGAISARDKRRPVTEYRPPEGFAICSCLAWRRVLSPPMRSLARPPTATNTLANHMGC